MTLRQTPLHSRHTDLGAKMADFGGWDMPIEYAGTVGEHTAVREDVGVFDVSHMGYTEVTGPGAIAWLNTVVANDLDRVGPGQAQYNLLCDESGGVIDDLIVYRIDDDHAFIVPNASNSDAVVAALTAAATGSGITVADKREDYGILAVQGPRSDAILEAVAKVSEVAADDIPPTSHPLPLENVQRPDEVRPCLPREAVLAGAPAAEDDRFRVPRILNEE